MTLEEFSEEGKRRQREAEQELAHFNDAIAQIIVTLEDSEELQRSLINQLLMENN